MNLIVHQREKHQDKGLHIMVVSKNHSPSSQVPRRKQFEVFYENSHSLIDMTSTILFSIINTIKAQTLMFIA